jgi:3-oxoacyl-[acyl-carrier protein] reductase
MIDLQEKVCIVTGGARGLGAAIAKTFYDAGAKVALWDLEPSETVIRKLDPDSNLMLSCQVDVTLEKQVQEAVGQVMARHSRIDVLVNSAGILMHQPIEELTVEGFERVIKVNLTGTFITCKAVVPVMKKQGRGKIINIASLGGRTGRPGVGVNYAASKAGVIGLTQTLAKELGPAGIYVNAIAPGPIMTEMTLNAPPEAFARWRAGRAVDRDGKPEDVAHAAFYLASGLSDWVTGTTLDVNGGIYIR